MPRPGHTATPVNPHAENAKLPFVPTLSSACSAPSKLDRLTIPNYKMINLMLNSKFR